MTSEEVNTDSCSLVLIWRWNSNRLQLLRSNSSCGAAKMSDREDQLKVKQSHYRPWQVLMVPGGWGSQILRQSAHKGGKVVSPTHRPPLPQGNIPGTHFCSVRGWVDPRAIVRPEGLCQWKIPVTPSGVDPAIFRFVAQCLNHCATAYEKASYIFIIRLRYFSSEIPF
jgi:hypothetical protein